MNDWSKLAEPLAEAGIRCYELFRDGNVAFEREGIVHFGPQTKLSALLSGSLESFLAGEAAQAKIAQLHAQQKCVRSNSFVDVATDALATTRKRWEAERTSGQWSSEYVREQFKGLR